SVLSGSLLSRSCLLSYTTLFRSTAAGRDGRHGLAGAGVAVQQGLRGRDPGPGREGAGAGDAGDDGGVGVAGGAGVPGARGRGDAAGPRHGGVHRRAPTPCGGPAGTGVGPVAPAHRRTAVGRTHVRGGHGGTRGPPRHGPALTRRPRAPPAAPPPSRPGPPAPPRRPCGGTASG